MNSSNDKLSEIESDSNVRRTAVANCVAIGLLLVLAVGCGILTFSAALAPSGHVQMQFLPQFLYALISAVVVMSAVMLAQDRDLRAKSAALANQARYCSYLEKFSVIDPVTQVFTRAYLDQSLAVELRRANVQGTTVTFLLIQGDGAYELIRDEQYLITLSRILKSTFRGSDIILRYSETAFLVILPDTNEQQSTAALTRLQSKLDHFNLNSASAAFDLAFVCGISSCPPGGNSKAALALAETKLQQINAARQYHGAQLALKSENGLLPQ